MTVSDADAAGPAVDSVVIRAPFPFWLGTIQVTGNSLTGFDGLPLNGAIIFVPSAPVYVPGWSVLEGSATMTVVNGIGATITLVCTDAVSPGFTYTLYQRLNTPDETPIAPITGVTVPHTLGITVDVSALL